MARCTIVRYGDDLAIGFTHEDFYRVKDDLKELPSAVFRRKRWWVDARFKRLVLAWAERWFSPPEILADWDDPRAPEPEPESTRPRRPLTAPLTLQHAYAMLHLRDSAPKQVIAASYRAMALLLHPDAGGDHAAMVALNRAMDVIRAHQEG
jgi:hypothetical protein